MKLIRPSFIASTPTETWEAPYLAGADREETDTISGGMRLGWEHIFGTGLELSYTKRSVELDDELSGKALGLTPAQQSLLNCEGDIKEFLVSYFWRLADNHILNRPILTNIDYDLGGEAIDGYQAKPNYAYTSLQDWEFVVNLLVGHCKAMRTTPFMEKAQTSTVVAFHSHPPSRNPLA